MNNKRAELNHETRMVEVGSKMDCGNDTFCCRCLSLPGVSGGAITSEVEAVTQVAQWVRDLTEEVMGGPPFAVGDTVKHSDGRTVKIMAGQYWGTYGLSNFWYWQEVRGCLVRVDVPTHHHGRYHGDRAGCPGRCLRGRWRKRPDRCRA